MISISSPFTGAASLDGVTWTTAGSITLALPSTLYLGLAVTSHNDGVGCTADLDNITLPGGTTPPTTTTVNPPTALSVTWVSSTQLNLSWTDQSTNETGFQLERSPDNTRFSLLTSLGANQTSSADLAVAAATTYYYRIHAVAGATPSIYSNTAAGTTPTTPRSPPRRSPIHVFNKETSEKPIEPMGNSGNQEKQQAPAIGLFS